jgi:hypothetical protein
LNLHYFVPSYLITHHAIIVIYTRSYMICLDTCDLYIVTEPTKL